MVGTGDCHTKQNKPDSRSQASYMWIQERKQKVRKESQGVRETKEGGGGIKVCGYDLHTE